MNKAERLLHDGADDPVLFFGRDHEHWEFSNFSRHEIILPSPWTLMDTLYWTSEHRFAAMKATNQKDHDLITGLADPGEAKDAGRRIQLRDDWGNSMGTVCWYVMFEAVLAKAHQHADVGEALRGTGTRQIYEDSPTDDIWGWRHRNDYRGKNLLGEVLMHVRSFL